MLSSTHDRRKSNSPFLLITIEWLVYILISALSPVSGDPKVVTEDEEYKKVNFEKFASLRAVFQKDGMFTRLHIHI